MHFQRLCTTIKMRDQDWKTSLIATIINIHFLSVRKAALMYYYTQDCLVRVDSLLVMHVTEYSIKMFQR